MEKTPIQFRKIYSPFEKKIIALVVIELGSIINWDSEILKDHLRHTYWRKDLKHIGNTSKASLFGWKIGDTLESKFNTMIQKGTGGDKIYRKGNSLKSQWQKIAKLASSDLFLNSSEFQVNEELTQKFSKALFMDAKDKEKISSTIREKIRVVAKQFFASTNKTKPLRKSDNRLNI